MTFTTNSKNKERTATQQFLEKQLANGFVPKWCITYHLHHPSEMLRPVKETNNPFGHKDRYGFNSDLWNYLLQYEYLENQRTSYDAVVRDTQKIKNIILRKGYGIKRLNQTWKYEFPKMIFAHELGKFKHSYHTHLLLPKIINKLNSVNTIEQFFHTHMRYKVKCISRWKSTDVREIYAPCNLLSYINKETMKNINAIDYQNSNF